MKAAPDCYQCLRRLVHQAAQMATDDPKLRSKAIEKGLEILDESFSPEVITIQIATKVHQAIKELTKNPDPYLRMKEEEIRVARELSREASPIYTRDLRGCLMFSAVGNAIDFFRGLDIIKQEVQEPIEFVIDDAVKLEERLKDSQRILFLADNVGEVFFDVPLIEMMKDYGQVTYVVKGSPVQDDITLEDLSKVGLEKEMGRVITTGTATPGIDFSLASAQFKEEFALADLVFAKGMGYYETLSELPSEGKVFYCLMAKCKPVAASLGVPLDSYVAMLR